MWTFVCLRVALLQSSVRMARTVPPEVEVATAECGVNVPAYVCVCGRVSRSAGVPRVSCSATTSPARTSSSRKRRFLVCPVPVCASMPNKEAAFHVASHSARRGSKSLLRSIPVVGSSLSSSSFVGSGSESPRSSSPTCHWAMSSAFRFVAFLGRTPLALAMALTSSLWERRWSQRSIHPMVMLSPSPS